MNTSQLQKFLLLPCLYCCIAAVSLFSSCKGRTARSEGDTDTIALAAAPTFCPDSAMYYVKAQCAFGPRVPGSEAHRACGDWIAQQFRDLGADVVEQRTTLTGYDGKDLPCRNIGASFGPDFADRVLFTAHWDSRAWADNDPDESKHHTPVPAANDGASGVAVMLEIARQLQSAPLGYGVDFVCFDCEDQGRPQWADDNEGDDETGYWCLGSRYWAEQALTTGYTARYAVNLDMVGGRGARFLMEGFSCHYAQPVVNMVWHLGVQLGYGEFFVLREGGYVTDDHLPVNRIAQIPAIDIIPHTDDGESSFGPTWHTFSDTPEHIDPAALTAVGQTLLQLIYNDNR